MNGNEAEPAVLPAKPRILVADDEPGFRKLISYELSGTYEVLTAGDGEEAVRQVKAGGVDVVVSDMSMPKLGGLDALSAIKAIDPGVEVIIVTGYATLETAVDGMKRGAYDFISKPFQLDDLTRMVARALEKRRLSRSVDELKEINRFKSEFLANMSHELRTPMNAILGYTSLHLDGIYGAVTLKQKDALRRVEASGRSLLQIINAILDLSKMAAGRMPVYIEEFELGELVSDAARVVESLTAKKGLELKTEVPSGVYMRSDKTKIKQILINLVGNAVKFTSKGGVYIKAEADNPAGRLRLSVRDTGAGIRTADLPQLFQEFGQLDASSTREHGGTGLGLVISSKFAQLLGGGIEVQSDYGSGTTFTVTVPLESAARRELPADLLKATPEGGSKVILAIDDDPEVLRLLSDSMQGSGYGLVGALTAGEGLAMAARIKPFAITLDIMMPHQDGWSVLQALKNDPALRDIPVIIVSIMENKSLGFALGVADYIVKPFERSELLEKLRALERGGVRRQGPGQQVLVADAENTASDYMQGVLEAEGYDVGAARDYETLLARLETAPPDILFLDLMLPGLNGLELLEAVEKRRPAKTAVFVMTSRGLTPQEADYLQKRAETVIEKEARSLPDILKSIKERLAAIGGLYEGENTGGG